MRPIVIIIFSLLAYGCRVCKPWTDTSDAVANKVKANYNNDTVNFKKVAELVIQTFDSMNSADSGRHTKMNFDYWNKDSLIKMDDTYQRNLLHDFFEKHQIKEMEFSLGIDTAIQFYFVNDLNINSPEYDHCQGLNIGLFFIFSDKMPMLEERFQRYVKWYYIGEFWYLAVSTMR